MWAIACYLITTGLKGQSSMKLHRDLGVTQKTAWFLAHRIREAWEGQQRGFKGPIEVDETYVGGLEKNRHRRKRSGRGMGHGHRDKTPVAGVKDRATNRVTARVIERTDKPTLQGFIREVAKDVSEDGTKVYTDEAGCYVGLPNHETVRHRVGQYVDGQAHTNGIESFWSMLKRGYHGTYHVMSPKHLQRYVNEFAGRHNIRPLDTIQQMRAIIRGLEGKRLTYRELTAPPRVRA